MLQLKHIVKRYGAGDNAVAALKDVNLSFRASEFVSVLGPSGCGKTTLLNIIGGLDRYTSGDLVIDGKSTKDFAAADWDAYRNHSVGFVFQSYNLIPHLTVLGNVELALTLSGVGPGERRRRAAEALTRVGLKEQLNKRPNQLSGGQMQRVAIARALVNDPQILLADEPTGALDSGTSVQIMELLREIADERLIIMVTHNGELADRYSTRIIRLLDGEIEGDTDPYAPESVAPASADSKSNPSAAGTAPVPAPAAAKPAPQRSRTVAEEQRPRTVAEELNRAPARRLRAEKVRPRAKKVKKAKKPRGERTSMSFFTALHLSFKNLVTKKGRTFMTAFAGSIGIIGVALVLAISNGFSAYITRMQSDTLAGYPITIDRKATTEDIISAGSGMMGGNENPYENFPDDDVIYPYDKDKSETEQHTNKINADYLDYVLAMPEEYRNSISFSRYVSMHLLQRQGSEVKQLPTSPYTMTVSGIGTFTYPSKSGWQELFDNDTFLADQYDVLGSGRFPKERNEIAVVVDKYNRLPTEFLEVVGVDYEDAERFSFEDFVGITFRLVMNDDYYEQGADGKFSARTDLEQMYGAEDCLEVKVVGILRQKQSASSALLSSGLAYTSALTDYVLENAKQSAVTRAQAAATAPEIVLKNFNYNTGETKQEGYERAMRALGADDTPSTIRIYPKDFKSKALIKEYLDGYNVGKAEEDQIIYTDLAEAMTTSMGTMVNIISYVLIAFAAISLIVSSIMIGIITYASVIERTKEIGVLRSIGARKKDISRVFNAETILIGFVAGLIGVAAALLLTIPINILIANLSGIAGIAALSFWHGLLLVVISMALTLVAGLVPARIAANKDPVVALRSE